MFVQTDKAGNIAIICKKFYVEILMKELGLFQAGDQKKKSPTYILAAKHPDDIISRHQKYMMANLKLIDMPESLPFLYWIPKMHKKPYSKQRFIAASAFCSTKPLSAVLTKCFALIERQKRLTCKRYKTSFGIVPMWIIHNSKSVHDKFVTLNQRRKCHDIRTYDFSTLYTSIPHKKLKARMAKVISQAFKSSKRSYISVYSKSAAWADLPNKRLSHLVVRMLFA